MTLWVALDYGCAAVKDRADWEMGSPVRREWFRSAWESRVLVSSTTLQGLRKYPLLSFFHTANWTL
jgi:hypothetical protein